MTGHTHECSKLSACFDNVVGVYIEAAFQGLDRLIADAGQRGVKLIITFTDNWHLQDGLQQVCPIASAVPP